ncbi:hypothetical protein KGF54_002876 [Candida jiufengensis]|uniref:uncharacterized protein n=1 Tax=Candida jiufengensis TaxID=497108 RepID=UPI002224AC61|nr:uncharacterized protein KGF54_002876 [Candida jiufengensis]KAI5953504.1 hypothetical protein KGF54_002876 [Candida jiufengensis]
MDDDKLDEISTITTLVNQSNQKVNESGENLNKVNLTVQSLVPEDVYKRLIETSTSEPPPPSKIQILEDQRLQLVMELQKQDFITQNLKELINQNQEILDTVKEFLQTQPNLKEEERIKAKLLLENYIRTSIEPTIKNLKNT